MRLIEVQALENGAHNNQTISADVRVPDGWAVIPDNMETENFPFGGIEVDYSGEHPVVTKWTPGNMPEPEPEDPEPALDDRVTALEEAISTGLTLYEEDLGNG